MKLAIIIAGGVTIVGCIIGTIIAVVWEIRKEKQREASGEKPEKPEN